MQVSQFKPKEFAAQMQLHLENSWAVLRAIIHECMQLPGGKYLLLKGEWFNLSKVNRHRVYPQDFERIIYPKGFLNFFVPDR